MPKDGLRGRVCHAQWVVSARRGRVLWCEDVQKSSRYDGELDEGLQYDNYVRVEFECLNCRLKVQQSTKLSAIGSKITQYIRNLPKLWNK